MRVAEEKILPVDEVAERCVLSTILRDGNAFYSALSIVNESDFVSTKHSLIFRAMVELSQKQSEIDILTVVSRLRSKGQIEESGGMDYLDELESWVPTPQAVTHFSKAVKKKSILRDLARAGESLFNSAWEEGDPDDVINEIQERV